MSKGLTPKEKTKISIRVGVELCKSANANCKRCIKCFAYTSCYENGKKREQNDKKCN